MTMALVLLATILAGPAEEDRVLLAEARHLSGEVADRIWPGWNRAPFALLLVSQDREFAMGYPGPPDGFVKVGEDNRLGGTLYSRERVFPQTLLATFPFAGLPTIVVGTPRGSGVTDPASYVVTLLHERFHQMQYSTPGYYLRAEALGLARGDTTGRWMLDFPFPYESEAAAAAYADMGRELGAALDAPEEERAARLGRYLASRERLRAAVSSDDFAYAALQMWQEGVARFAELRAAEEAASERYAPTLAFGEAAGAGGYRAAAARIRGQIRDGLREADLPARRRVAFYDAGAGEALLLDAIDPGWKGRYLTRMFDLGPLLAATRARSGSP